ncbi:Increased DNA methylation 1, partial [Mucuna pruriens]
MREGLRSRTRLGTISGGGGVVRKEKVGVKSEAVDLGDQGLEAQNSTIEKKGEVERGVKEECGFDLNVSANGDVDLAENASSRSCFSGGDSTVVAEVDRKAKNEQGSNDEVLVGGRVLRSRSKRRDDRRSYDGENEGVFSGNNGEHSGCERVEVKKECEDADQFLSDSCDDEMVKVKKAGNDKRKLKRKRGRPPKAELKEQDQSVDQLPRKRGRRPKAGRQNNLGTVVAHNGKGKGGVQKGKEGLPIRDDANVNATDDTNSRKSVGNELEKKEFSPVKKNNFSKVLETDNNVVASPLGSNTVNPLVTELSGKREVKQLVRDQIKERLSAAGWTVDYRPRNGREYKDAVYVSLDGHTHWSITLAYKTLKKYYEAGNGEGKVYGPGFKFTPIPEEDFKILTKVINKQRTKKDKLVQKGGKGGKKVDGKKNNEKSGSSAGTCKSMKRKMKRKWSLGNTDVTSPNNRKRQKTQNKKRCALLVRNAEEIDSEVEGYVPYSGKRTLLAWMIDLGIVPQNAKVHYMPHKSKSAVLDGKITGDGIHCGCCNKIITISDFEVHAGSKQGDPLKNIYVEEGTSLLQCLLDSWNKQDESERKGFHFVDVAGEDPNDDTCGVCGDGGNLICCDGCPSTFHQGCLDIKKFPSGDWHCIYCCCKFCGSVGGSSNQRDGNDELTVSKLLTCQLCEEKYHRSCIEANDANIDDSRDVFFCGNKCQELSERLEMLLGVKHEIEDGYFLTFIRRSDVGFDASQIKPQMVECNSKLAVALSIMDECFMPYIDHRSGTNLIHSILYNCGSNFNRLNYSGFVTAILERGDEIISAASIRIHGNQLAEMPFVGTRYMYRRQGMCRRLLNAIEWALSSLNVELLVIPAISELRETWTSVFGFEPLELTSKQIINNMNLLVFPHVDMLQKKISKHKLAGQNLIPAEASHLKRSQIANNCDGAGSSGSDLNYAEITRSNACQINDETISIESGCHLPEGSLNNEPDIGSNTIDHWKSSKDDTCQVVHENLVMEDNNSIENACDYVTDTSCRAEDSQLNCGVPYGERRCLTSCISTEGTEGFRVGVSLEVTENFPNQVKVACEVISNNSAERAAPCGAESIPLDSKIVFGTKDSKDSSDCIDQDSHKISDSCRLRSKTDCCQPNLIGTKEVHAESVGVCGFPSRPEGDCASGEAAPTTNVLMHLRSQNITNNMPWMKGSSELAEPDLQVDQTARNNAPSLWTPNTASGTALHWASAGSASCGSTEGIVLSNQAS